MTRISRGGFALLLVLWMLVGVAALGAGLVSAERYALRSSTNRVLLARGAWQAEGCIEWIRAAIDDTLGASSVAAEAAWRSLDNVLAVSSLTGECAIDARPAGVTLDVNAASPEELTLVMQAAGVRPETADSITDAILDWEDADDSPRSAGAESVWYSEHGQLTPRNGPIASVEELARVRGVSLVPGIDTLLGVEPGRVLIGRAPAAVIMSLPGFGPEAMARAVDLSDGRLPRDLLEFSSMLSPPARQELLAHFAEVQSRVTFSPDAWIITARAEVGRPAVTSELEVRLVRAGRRAAIVRRRSWP